MESSGPALEGKLVYNDSSVSSIPEHIDRTLITFKTEDALVRCHEKEQTDWNHKLGEPPIPIVRWKIHKRECLFSVYEGLCEDRERQGNKITPEFIRGVVQENIRNLLKESLDALRNHPRINHMPDEARKSYLGQIDYAETGLLNDLFRKIEIEALELEYRDKENPTQNEKNTSEKKELPGKNKRGRPSTAKVKKRIEIVKHYIKTKADWNRDTNYEQVCLELHKEKVLTPRTQEGFQLFPGCSWQDIASFTGRDRSKAIAYLYRSRWPRRKAKTTTE